MKDSDSQEAELFLICYISEFTEMNQTFIFISVKSSFFHIIAFNNGVCYKGI